MKEKEKENERIEIFGEISSSHIIGSKPLEYNIFISDCKQLKVVV